MKKFKTLMVIMVLACSAAQADEGKEGVDSGPKGECKSCNFHRRFDLTSEQKEKMRDIIFKFKEKKIHLEADLKLKRLNFEKTSSSPNADYKSVKSAAQEVAEGVSKVVAAKLALKAQIDFEVLTAEQRKEMQARMGMMGHPGHHRRGPHHGPGGPGGKRWAEQSVSEDNEALPPGPMISMEDDFEEDSSEL